MSSSKQPGISAYPWSGQRFLVTGSAGFIGSHLCERLLNLGSEVVGLDNLNDYYDPEIKRANLAAIEQTAALQQSPSGDADRTHGDSKAAESRFVFHYGDIRDREFVLDLFRRENIDVVINLAAMAGVRLSIEDPKLYTEVNIMGTIHILEGMREAGVQRHIFASSSSVYGNNTSVPFREQDPVDAAISPYAATKKAGEVICYTYHHLYHITTACLRFFTVYGPRQRPDLAIHKFTRLMHEGKPIPFFGDGTMQRDHTYIDDILDGVVKTIMWTDRTSFSESSGEPVGTTGGADASGQDNSTTKARYDIFNLGESRTITLTELVQAIAGELGVEPEIERLPVPPGDVKCTFADISHARDILGYAPQTKLEDGLKRFMAWFREHV